MVHQKAQRNMISKNFSLLHMMHFDERTNRKTMTSLYEWASINYVDRILRIFDPTPPFVDKFTK